MEWKILLVLAILVLLVVGVNGMLVLIMRKGSGNENSRIRLMQRAANQARNPWKGEDEKLKELSDLVDKLNPPENDNT